MQHSRTVFPNCGRTRTTEVKLTPNHVLQRQQSQHARIAAKMAKKQKLALADEILAARKKGILEVKAARAQERRIAKQTPRLASKTPQRARRWQNPEVPHSRPFAKLAEIQL